MSHQDAWLKEVMEQAQVFASAWSLVGGPFDGGDALEQANAAKAELQAMLQHRAQPSEPAPATVGLPESVRAELGRAMAKFPTWPSDPLHALAVLGEEFGELTQAVLQRTYEPHKGHATAVHDEAVQTAAMALRFLASLNHYVYSASAQHTQVPSLDATA